MPPRGTQMCGLDDMSMLDLNLSKVVCGTGLNCFEAGNPQVFSYSSLE